MFSKYINNFLLNLLVILKSKILMGYSFSRFCYIIILVINAFNFRGQSDSVMGKNKQFLSDSLTFKFKTDSIYLYRYQKVRPCITLDNRITFIRGIKVNVRGFQTGFILYGRITASLGLYLINHKTARNVKIKVGDEEALITTKLNYATLYYQYSIIYKKYFEVDIPFEIGLGNFDINAIAQIDNRLLEHKNGLFIPIGSGLKCVVKPIKQIGISGTIGYRYVPDNYIKINLNGIYYAIGIWVDIRQIYRDINFYGFKRRKYRNAIKKL